MAGAGPGRLSGRGLLTGGWCQMRICEINDIASVAFWYQTLPTPPFASLPDRDYLEVI